MDLKLKDFIHNQVSTTCDADPEILTNYVLALLGESKPTADIKSSLREKLQEFFEDETTGFIDRLYSYLDNNNKPASKDGGEPIATRPSIHRDAEDEDDEEEEEEGDRSFKHRRHRHEDDDDDHYSSKSDIHPNRQKRRLSHQDDSEEQNKLRRNYRPHRDDPEASGMAGGSSNSDRRGGGYQGRYNGNYGRPGWKNSRPMCKDYNEKGYCVRGDLCPYDHGKDTIVYEDKNPLSNQMMPMMPTPPNLPFTMPNMPNMPNILDKGAFSPENMTMMQNAMTNFPGMMPSPEDFMKTMMQQQQQQQYGRSGGPMRRGRGAGAGAGGRGRGRGGYGQQMNSDRYNNQQQPQQLTTTLVIDNIPPEKCQMIPINDYFKKFGNITNINLQSQKALVQFSTRAEAEAAHASPDVIFDNRFVKVYWHKETSGDSVQSGGGRKNNNIGDDGKWTNKQQQRRDVTHGGDISGSTAPPPASDEPDPSLVAAKAAELQKLRDAKLKMRQEQMKAILDLQKQKEQLLQQQIDEQKKLMAKLTDKSLSQTQKEDLLRSLRKISSDIDTSKSNSTQAAPTPSPTTTSPESSNGLKEKLAKLQAEAASMGISPDGVNRPSPYSNVQNSGYYGHGGGWPPRGGGGAMMMKRSLDNRPTKVMIKDIPQEMNNEELKEHFGQFGQVISFENTQDGMVAHYSQRFEAEKAMAMGSNLGTCKLSLSWYTHPLSSSPNV